jgi:hypothetical protein
MTRKIHDAEYVEVTPARTEKIDGYYFTFTESEQKKVNEMLTVEGYTPDAGGLKLFILDCAEPVENEPDPIQEAAEQLSGIMSGNPDAVRNAFGKAGRIVGAAFFKNLR